MPETWIPNSGSQLERALRQYFIAEGAIPNAKHPTKGILLTLDTHPRCNPLRTILAHDANEEVPFSGNDVWDVLIVDQFDAMEQPGEKYELRRAAIDQQLGAMMRLMSMTDNHEDFNLTAKNITDAGRSLVETQGADLVSGNWPFISETHVESHKVVGGFTVGRRYRYVAGNSTGLFTANENVDGSGPTGAGDEIAAGYFTATQAQYHLYGPNDESAITASLKLVSQNNEDMAEFTCLFVTHNGKSRGHPKDEQQGINESTWREARSFRITVAPSAIVGYSNTSGE